MLIVNFSDNYIQKVPKDNRPFFLPRTPNKLVKYSRRQWDGLIKAWKLQIHAWNAKGTNEEDFLVVDEWKEGDENESKPEEEEEEEDDLDSSKATARSFTFSWCDDVEEEEELQKRRKKDDE